MLLEELADPGPQPGMPNLAVHILLGHLFRLGTLGFAGVLEGLVGCLARTAHAGNRVAEGVREQGDDGADVGCRVGSKADLGLERVEFDRFLAARIERASECDGNNQGVK